MSENAKKKPSASEVPNNGSADKLLQQYAELMRETGSPNGAWNPDPDEQTTGMLRDDVVLSSNEIKAIFGVKAYCLRNNPIKGRTAWGWTETGKPFRATELGNLFGWDPSNTLKHLARPLAYGFIRKDKKTGQLGIGGLVRGKFVEPKPETGTPSEVDLLVCTYQLPRYLAEAVCSQLTENRKVAFLEGWKAIKTKKQQELNAEKQRIYESEQNELSEHCRTFDPHLPELKRKRAKAESDEAGTPQDHWYVHTTSVQNVDDGPYNGSERSVHTGINKESKESKVSSSSETVSTPVEDPPQEPTTATPEVEAIRQALFDATGEPADAKVSGDIWRGCRNRDARATVDEVVSLIGQKAGKWRGPGHMFFVPAVVECFPIARGRPKPAESSRGAAEEAALQRWREEQEALLSNPNISEQEKHLIRLCLGLDEPERKPPGEEIRTQAQKAGGG
jgi:hypothetical protein